jgi:hypothetical protein
VRVQLADETSSHVALMRAQKAPVYISIRKFFEVWCPMRAALIVLVSLTSVGALAAPLQISCSLESRSQCIRGQECRDVSQEFRLDQLRWNFTLDREARHGTVQRCEGADCAVPFPVMFLLSRTAFGIESGTRLSPYRLTLLRSPTLLLCCR